MGYYINPPTVTKEEFLAAFGKPLTDEEVKSFNFEADALPVCFVDNGAFTAAGIAYDARERDQFLRPDGRPKWWFSVPFEELKPYLPPYALPK